MLVQKMELIVQCYSATETQEQERAVSRKREPSTATAGNKIMVLLTDWDGSSLIMNKLCDDGVEEDTALEVLGRGGLVYGGEQIGYGS